MRNYLLGGAQLGKGYGHFVSNPMLTGDSLSKLITYAYSEGVKEIDGAQNYSQMFEQIAKIDLVSKFSIGTKIEYKSSEEGQVISELRGTLSTLNKISFSFLLIHNWHRLEARHKKKAFNFLIRLKNEGICSKIGISVYEVNEIEDYLKDVDIIQAPLNFFNTSFLKDDRVLKLRELGLEFHARGIFHQGTLLNTSRASEIFPSEFAKFEEFCVKNSFSKIQAALSVYDTQEIFSRLVIGVNSDEELSSILNTPIVFRATSIHLLELPNDQILVDPRRWVDFK